MSILTFKSLNEPKTGTIFRVNFAEAQHFRDFFALQELADAHEHNNNLKAYAQSELQAFLKEAGLDFTSPHLLNPIVSGGNDSASVTYSPICLLPHKEHCSGYTPKARLYFRANDCIELSTSLSRNETPITSNPCMLRTLEDALKKFNDAGLTDNQFNLKGLPENSIVTIEAKEGFTITHFTGLFPEAVERLCRLYEAIGYDKLKRLDTLRNEAKDKPSRRAYEQALEFAVPIFLKH